VIASAVLWGSPIEGAARELLAAADEHGDSEGGSLSSAKEFLLDLLFDGPLSMKAIKADAEGAGHSWSTIRRAKKALKIEAKKQGMKDGWVWVLPEEIDIDGSINALLQNAKMPNNAEDAQQNMVGTFGKSEHLRANSEMEVVL